MCLAENKGDAHCRTFVQPEWTKSKVKRNDSDETMALDPLIFSVFLGDSPGTVILVTTSNPNIPALSSSFL